MDSIDAIPFANDNAGTIKQRAMSSNQYHQNYNSSSSSSSSSIATTVNGGLATSSVSTTPSIANKETNIGDDGIERGATCNDVASNAATIDSNVLNDIGNMLAHLTVELDAMLEEEKRVGINDSE